MKLASNKREAALSKLLTHGRSAVTTEELLFLLLSYAFNKGKKQNMSLLSELLSEYHTPEKCFAAVKEAAFSERFGEGLSRFLLLCGEIAELYLKKQYGGGYACRNDEDFVRIFREAYRYIDKEATLLLLLDNRMRVLSVEYVADGGFASASFRPDAAIRTALLHHASAAVIAANRQKEITVPTKEEIHAVGYIKESMEKAGIPLLSGFLISEKRHTILSSSESKSVRPLAPNELAAHLEADKELSLPERDELCRERQNTLLSLLSYGTPENAEIVLLGLLRRGFDIKGVLSAETAELLNCEGMTKDCACLLIALGEIIRRMNTSGCRTEKPLDERSAALLVRELSEGFTVESVYLLLLDASKRLIAFENIGYGVANAAVILPRRLLELAIYHGASAAYLVHTHPNGVSTPSAEDIAVTRSLLQIFSDAACPLLEHIVVSERSYTPILSYIKKSEAEI